MRPRSKYRLSSPLVSPRARRALIQSMRDNEGGQQQQQQQQQQKHTHTYARSRRGICSTAETKQMTCVRVIRARDDATYALAGLAGHERLVSRRSVIDKGQAEAATAAP